MTEEELRARVSELEHRIVEAMKVCKEYWRTNNMLLIHPPVNACAYHVRRVLEDEIPELTDEALQGGTWKIGGKVVTAEEGAAAMRKALSWPDEICSYCGELNHKPDCIHIVASVRKAQIKRRPLIVEGVLLCADVPDSEGNIYPAEEVRKMADNKTMFWDEKSKSLIYREDLRSS